MPRQRDRASEAPHCSAAYRRAFPPRVLTRPAPPRVRRRVQLGVLQFSNDVRTEMDIAPLSDVAGAFAASVAAVARMNGGTNFCAPLRCGARLTRTATPTQRRARSGARARAAQTRPTWHTHTHM
jgi:hypothetical protein